MDIKWTGRLYVVFNNIIDQVLSWYEEWRKNGWSLAKESNQL